MGPAGGSIDGAGVARGFDEGLDEHGRGVVALGPVPGQAVADDGEDVRAEVGDMDPGHATAETDIRFRSRSDAVADFAAAFVFLRG